MQKKWRLTNRSDFHKVYRLGRSTANRQFVLYLLPHRGKQQFRMGVSVSKKVGNAVVRNRLRRRIKEMVRLNQELVGQSVDLIVIVRKPVVEMDYQEMEKSLLHVLRKASLLSGKI